MSAKGAELTSRAGAALLGGLADRLGLTEGLIAALRVHSRTVRHEPGRVVRDLAVMLADGGDALCDLGVLRDQQVLFGCVASDATAYRCLERLDEELLSRIRAARAAARARAWKLGGAGRRIILDIDATLLTAHSEKEGAAGNYKGGFGFHPLLCFEASTGEALAGILRPGNAGANTAADHIALLELALAQLPEGVAGPGTLVRCDSAGATHAFLDEVVARGLCFSVGCDLTERVRAAILALPESAWSPALDSAGDPREGAWVAELSLDLSAWPAGARALCRRERPHPGAQLSFADADSHRFQVILTNQRGRRLARLEQLHRRRAAIEDGIRRGKATGMRNLPFRAYAMNAAWPRAGAHRRRSARLVAAPAARRHEARELRAQAPALPPPARRRAHRAPRARREAAPLALLALGGDARPRLHAPQGLTLRLSDGRPPGQTQALQGWPQPAFKKAAGRAHGLQRGANVIMPNLTPVEERERYEIYPEKAAVHETAEAIDESIMQLLSSLGRTAGTGAGGRGAA